MKRPLLAVLVWLLVAGAGAAALFTAAQRQLTETFNTDARILHRVLSQRMEQQEAVLNAVDALEHQALDAAVLGSYLGSLLRPYPQIVAVERCTAQGCQVLGTPTEQPPFLSPLVAAEPAVRWPQGGGPLYALSHNGVRV
ncbi:hypothetical protein [Deinococcus alpinitundrae]|uniref:hypothetical protein n=1 Tax=Deinococcus alpinitundrae TaxID=468913 RepID=UPI0013799A22|nr:hypothetical protein [Deinococcus alpinitundrae]